MSARGPGILTWGLGVLLAALLAAIVVVVGSAPAVDEDLTADQREVAAAARTEALAFLTVDHRDMDPLIDAVLAGATGDFKEQYAAQRARLVRQAKRTDAVSTAEIVALGVGDLDEDSATVLVAANSDVSNIRTGLEAQTRYFRLRLDLVRADDRWLTSNVEFVR